MSRSNPFDFDGLVYDPPPEVTMVQDRFRRKNNH